VAEQTESMLHDWRIEEREYARHEHRRGRRQAFEQIDPRRTGLVVVDMVPFFVNENPFCGGIVPNIQQLATSLRRAGGAVAWVLPGMSVPSPLDEELLGPDIAKAYGVSGGTGTRGERLWHEFDVSEDDILAEKTAHSAFFPGRSDLPAQLNARRIDTVERRHPVGVPGSVAPAARSHAVHPSATQPCPPFLRMGRGTRKPSSGNAAITSAVQEACSSVGSSMGSSVGRSTTSSTM
jgi:hypothetical protein